MCEELCMDVYNYLQNTMTVIDIAWWPQYSIKGYGRFGKLVLHIEKVHSEIYMLSQNLKSELNLTFR